MAMSLSEPHPEQPYRAARQEARRRAVRARRRRGRSEGLLALVGLRRRARPVRRVRPLRAGPPVLRDRRVRGARRREPRGPAATTSRPGFSIWTTIEECLNPPVVWEKDRGWFTLPPFSEPEIFTFPEGIGPVECVHVEHEEVLLDPAVDRVPPRDLQVRPRRRVHRGAPDAPQARAGQQRAGSRSAG